MADAAESLANIFPVMLLGGLEMKMADHFFPTQRKGGASLKLPGQKQVKQETSFIVNGKRYNRLPYGKEGPKSRGISPVCPDCGAKPKELHTLGCDVERCPICHRQLITCEHSYLVG